MISFNYDPYILGDKPLNNMKLMKSLDFDLGNINGHDIKKISEDIQNLLDKENNKPSSVLYKIGYYITASITVGLAIGVLGGWSLGALGINLKFAPNRFVLSTLIISFALFRLFDVLFKTDQIEIKTNVKLESNKKWGNEKNSLNNWLAEIPKIEENFNQFKHRGIELLKQNIEYEDVINSSIQKVDVAVNKFKVTVSEYCKLPTLQRDILKL